jgi:putative ABC transport system permease protein
MSLWKIALRSIQQRSFSSALTGFSMSLGVGLVVAVLVIHGVISQSFQRGVQGYDLIIGAKGSRLDLVLSTVFHIGQPAGTISNRTYYRLKTGQKYSSEIEAAVPMCMGDTFKGFRVIGTTPDMLDSLREYAAGKHYEWQEGGNFEWNRPQDAAIGSAVAARTGLRVGDKFRPVHGDRAHGDEHGEFNVAGVLKPTGTPNDRGIFVNIAGFYAMHPHEEEKPGAKEDAHDHDHDHAASERGIEGVIPPDGEMSAILLVLKTKDQAKRIQLPRIMDRDPDLNVQAVEPTKEVARLFEGVIGDIQVILLILAALIVVVAGIGILVSMYNSMSERRHEIAIMRALGARRATVMMIVVFESILLALGGGAIGVLLGHGLTGALSPTIADRTGVIVSALQFQTGELILIPALVILATIVGYLPAIVAYRTDVAQSLISSP